MMQVYIHLPRHEAARAIAGGIKLSEKKERDFTYHGLQYNCFAGWLHPNDDAAHLASEDEGGASCLRLNIDARYCFVEDQDLGTIKPFAKYRLGEFRRPQCLVCCTVLPSRIKLQGRRLDEPLLYENSHELYIENLQAILDGQYQSFKNDQLCGFFTLLAKDGRFRRIEKDDCVLFVSNDGSYSFAKPDVAKYERDLNGL